MRSLPVISLDQGCDLDPGMGEAPEQRPVQKLIAHAAIETSDIAVLHRLARSDIMPLHAALTAPCEHGNASELCAIIAGDHPRLAMLSDQ